MKKITSVEYLVSPDEGLCEEQSTMVHTERKISLDERFEEETDLHQVEATDRNC